MWQTLVGPIASLLDKAIPDKDAREKMAHEIATIAERTAHEASMAQVDLNKAEAQHRSLFVAGWRPSLGWVCSLAFAWNFIVRPIATYVMAANGVLLSVGGLPELNVSELYPLLLGMLGLGGLRTYEKKNGVTK